MIWYLTKDDVGGSVPSCTGYYGGSSFHTKFIIPQNIDTMLRVAIVQAS